MIVCKYCQSKHINKYGTYKNIQRYFCQDCKRKFVSTDTIPKMKNSIVLISDFLNLYFEGMSLNEISRNFVQQNGKYISKVTLFNWGRRFALLAKEEADKNKPQVGDFWECAETMIHNRFCGKEKHLWLIAIMDRDSRFILASRISFTRNKSDLRIVFEEARKKAGKLPGCIMTDGWGGFEDGIELAFGASVTDIKIISATESNNLLSRLQGTFKERTVALRWLKTFEAMNEFQKGRVIHYNFFKSFLSLGGNTPAKTAGIAFPYTSWKEFIEKQPYALTSRIPLFHPSPMGDIHSKKENKPIV